MDAIKRGVPESRGGKPRENADDAYATIMEMSERERVGMLNSLVSGGVLTLPEQEGFERASKEIAALRIAESYGDACEAAGFRRDLPVGRFVEHHRAQATTEANLQQAVDDA